MPDHINPRTQVQHGAHTWCALCERVQLTENWIAKSWSCPTPGCSARADAARPWRKVREMWTRYPEKPEIGKRYSFSDPTGGI